VRAVLRARLLHSLAGPEGWAILYVLGWGWIIMGIEAFNPSPTTPPPARLTLFLFGVSFALHGSLHAVVVLRGRTWAARRLAFLGAILCAGQAAFYFLYRPQTAVLGWTFLVLAGMMGMAFLQRREAPHDLQ
jgi:peptidoglycan/LPS O-acetylase OafA/YrhL